jgi:hypothetical protein
VLALLLDCLNRQVLFHRERLVPSFDSRRRLSPVCCEVLYLLFGRWRQRDPLPGRMKLADNCGVYTVLESVQTVHDPVFSQGVLIRLGEHLS